MMEEYADILLTLILVAFVLFLVYPKCNGDFDHDYFEKKQAKKHWWEKEG